MFHLIILSIVMASITANDKVKFNPKLEESIAISTNEFDEIPEERKEMLAEMADFVRTQNAKGKTAELIFICTHNSRRSHMSQIWAKVAAEYYGHPNVVTYSGGTEATAFNPRAVAAMERAGFNIEKESDSDNPHYSVKYSNNVPALDAWSKKYEDDANPHSNFAAIMTCSAADEACPIVRGASARISIPYIDPKVSDNTDKEEATYDERCMQIAREMMYAFSLI